MWLHKETPQHSVAWEAQRHRVIGPGDLDVGERYRQSIGKQTTADWREAVTQETREGRLRDLRPSLPALGHCLFKAILFGALLGDNAKWTGDTGQVGLEF